ncbi:MAG: hypothetical protein K1X28_10265 [Parachlamydiales bacterium]|nr:hypothetical protein [Parachlamydiales bacterium]
MSLEEKIIAYKQLMREIEALEERKKLLSQEIISEMPDKKVEIADYRAYRYTRLSIKIPLEEARLLGATRMEEHVDKEKIKELHESGRQIEGVKEFSYLLVTSKQK